MTKVAPLLLLALVIGCAEPQPAGPDPASTAPPATAPIEPVSTAPAATPNPDPKPIAQTTKPGHNDQRLHQLYELKKATVMIGNHRFSCWVADDESTRNEGLMFVTKDVLKDGVGMIFAFPDEAPRSFWMRNTVTDLDIAYISKGLKVVSVRTMKALDESGVPSGGGAMYALEVRAGIFKRLGIGADQRVTISPSIKGK